MADYIDAGKLNKAAQVLELREAAGEPQGKQPWQIPQRAKRCVTGDGCRKRKP